MNHHSPVDTRPARFLFPLLGLIFAASPAMQARQDWLSCGTHALTTREAIALHRSSVGRGKPATLRSLAAGGASVARDTGNIAILEDTGGVVARRNPFNLGAGTLRFLPQASGYKYELAGSSYDAAQATAGSLLTGFDDDDSRLAVLPFDFPFFGQTYRSVSVNSDGNLTFTAPDVSTADRSLGRFNAGVPRIAPLFRDLDPSITGAAVRVLATANVLVVSWVNVPEYAASGNGPRQTFQVRLFPDGRIEAAYSSITTAEAVTGITPGNLPAESAIVAFTVASAQTYNGTLAERFSGAERVDEVFAAQKFYETHDDAYDYLVIFNNLGIAVPDAIAYLITTRSNTREGYGDIPADAGALFGSPRRLQGVMQMGPLNQYPRDPNAIVPGRSISRDTPTTVLAHEAGHLFLAFVSARNPGDPSAEPMLGRSLAHWSFLFNSEASLLEGNRIRDNGAGANPRFTTTGTVEAYSPLDQYLMGFRAAGEVPPSFYVSDSIITNSSRTPQTGVSFNGVRHDVTVQDIVDRYGPRADHGRGPGAAGG